VLRHLLTPRSTGRCRPLTRRRHPRRLAERTFLQLVAARCTCPKHTSIKDDRTHKIRKSKPHHRPFPHIFWWHSSKTQSMWVAAIPIRMD
jgi:hypothetical protein